MRPPAAAFECEVDFEPRTVIIRPMGELDVSTAWNFARVAGQAASKRVARTVLDLRGLEFCDSTGLHEILALAHAVPNDTDFEIIPGPESVQRVFVVTGVADWLPFRSRPA